MKKEWEPPCRGCHMRNEDNWEPVVEQKEPMRCTDACIHYPPFGHEAPCCDCGRLYLGHPDKFEPREQEKFEELLEGFQDVPGFNNQDMHDFLIHLQDEEMKVWQGKNKDYASREDNGNPFANFDEIAEETQLTSEKVLYVYLAKQLRAIKAYIKYGTLESGEGLLGRIIDARNFLGILGGMAKRRGVI